MRTLKYIGISVYYEKRAEGKHLLKRSEVRFFHSMRAESVSSE
jgi:hypothetical protein